MLSGLNGPTEASWSWEPKAKHGGSCVNSPWTERWNAFLGWWPSDWSALGECYWVVLSLCKWFQIISDSIFTQVALLGWTHQIAFLEVVHTPQENDLGLRWESTQSTQSRGPSPVACWQSPTATWHSMGGMGRMEKDGEGWRRMEIYIDLLRWWHVHHLQGGPAGFARFLVPWNYDEIDTIMMILIDSKWFYEFKWILDANLESWRMYAAILPSARWW